MVYIILRSLYKVIYSIKKHFKIQHNICKKDPKSNQTTK